MQRYQRIWQSGMNRVLFASVSFLALTGIGPVIVGSADAQSTVVGGRSMPQVEVNLGALDNVGGGSFAPTTFGAGFSPVYGRPPLPGDNMPGPQNLSEERIVLKPPAQMRRQSAAASDGAPAPRAERAPARSTKATATDRRVASAPVDLVPVAPSRPQPQVTSAPLPAVAPAPAPAPMPAPAAAAPVPLTPAPALAPAPAPQASNTLPPPAAAPAPAAQSQTAMVAPAPRVTAPTGEASAMTIRFDGMSATVPPDAERQLGQIAKQYANSEDRIQLKAYAGSTSSDGGSGARRLSLSRALAVRTYLIDNGVRSTRIDVRALGAAADNGAPDRVDVVVLGR